MVRRAPSFLFSFRATLHSGEGKVSLSAAGARSGQDPCTRDRVVGADPALQDQLRAAVRG